MRMFFLAFVISLAIADVSLAEVITFNDGKEITVDSCRVEGDDIFYQKAGINYQTNFSEVSGITTAVETENSPKINDLKEFNEWSEDREKSKTVSDLPPAEAMKKFAALVIDFYNHDTVFRKAAKRLAYEKFSGGERKYIGEDFLFKIADYANYNLVKFYKECDILTANLTGEEKSSSEMVYKGIVFYLAQLPGEEAVKAGLVPPVKSSDKDTPEYIKTRTLGLLALYKDGKKPEEHKKEIAALWERMRSSLIKGDIDNAVNCFSSSTKESYRKQFQALKESGVLKKTAMDMKNMQVHKIRYGEAEGDFRVNEKGKDFSYYVRFAIENEGKWKILQY